MGFNTNPTRETDDGEHDKHVYAKSMLSKIKIHILDKERLKKELVELMLEAETIEIQ